MYSEDEMYHDVLGYLRSQEEAFYDGEGYLRSSEGEKTNNIETLRGRNVPPYARWSNLPTGKMSNYSPRGYSTGNWNSWEIVIVVLMLIGLAMMTCGGPALELFS